MVRDETRSHALNTLREGVRAAWKVVAPLHVDAGRVTSIDTKVVPAAKIQSNE